jgi:hypothetical protein
MLRDSIQFLLNIYTIPRFGTEYTKLNTANDDNWLHTELPQLKLHIQPITLHELEKQPQNCCFR